MRLPAIDGNGLILGQRMIYMKSDNRSHEADHMTGQGEKPEAGSGGAADWVESFAPAAWRPYMRLSRLHAPIGTWLLLLPCWWGLVLAMVSTGDARLYDLWIFIGCGIGAVLMRGAGCTWNDITDRDFDGDVARTAARPIPAGDVTVRQAAVWMAAQCLVAFLILLTFDRAAILLGLVALVPVAIYPFAKRFTWWPQVFLGIAFNWGALLAWTAHTGALALPAVLLYLAGIAWTLFYDTIYAHQDTDDDALIGIRSTARLFGEATPQWLRRFLIASVTLMGLAVIAAALDRSILVLVVALGAPWAFGWHLTLQLGRFDASDTPGLDRLFRSNRNAGLLALLFFAGAALL